MTTAEFGTQRVARELQDRLARFIESRYHVANVSLIHERRALLAEPVAISQPPFVETTPTYEVGQAYAELDLPHGVGSALSELAALEPSVGIFPRPYVHQAEALRAFLVEDRDLVVATGTGSGKTETFLLPILCQLLIEAGERSESFAAPGLRALLLYPMNALVSDQVSRLRRLFGDPRLRDHFARRFGRSPRFGMYTSRTPYPGPRKADRDRREVRPLLDYYLEIERAAAGGDQDASELMAALRERGRWPALDLESFATTLDPQVQLRAPLPSDAEALTRHEMQRACPDILVTNYSMLEYMLIRPIERNFFAQTQDWLAQDDRNRLVLVLDEAHVYRGTAGAEVGYLIRRLFSRLGVPRDRIRCIITSASLGSGPEADRGVRAFASSLVGQRGSSSLKTIEGQRERRSPGRAATEQETLALAAIDVAALHARAERLGDAVNAVADLARALDWIEPDPSSSADHGQIRAYLYAQLFGWGPLELLIGSSVAEALAFDDLAAILFPSVGLDTARAALATLLELGTWAHDGVRPLLPTRVHLMFRGLPALFACINPRCEARRHSPGTPELLGRLYTEPRARCDCTAGARIFELLAHRTCGAAFLRAFGRGATPSFYWHEQGGSLGASEPLMETTLLVSEPHPDHRDKVEPIWIELSTGTARTSPPADAENYLAAYRPFAAEDRRRGGDHVDLRFRDCPACGKRNGGQKILGLATKGDQPFANLVRDQLVLQPATRTPSDRYPNGGRKVLLFSDGRQRAARLARDLPREVEFDSFRQALALAATRLEQIDENPILDKRLYAAFVSVCADFDLHFFDQEGRSQLLLLQDICAYKQRYDADLESFLEDRDALQLPPRFRQALLRQLSDPFHSLYAVGCAVVRPTNRALKLLDRELSPLVSGLPAGTLDRVASAWVQGQLEEGRFDADMNKTMRYAVLDYFREANLDAELRTVERVVKDRIGFGDEHIRSLRSALYAILTQSDPHGNRYLNPSRLELDIALDRPWFLCEVCRQVMDAPLAGCCVHCGRDKLASLPATDPVIASLTDYFREPMRRVLRGERPVHVTAEEHTAQLSYRDRGVVRATTEEYELRFQDVWLGDHKPPIDVLSCTTTMEVGVDIGSLNAIGLRNVPPQRENYQQRAGRAGRRGTAVSTVITYCQDGPHDAFYFYRPEGIISGPPRQPRIHIGNPRLAHRHINALLIQSFFHEQLDALPTEAKELVTRDGSLFSALGPARDFLEGSGPLSLAAFRRWIESTLSPVATPRQAEIADWLPDELVSCEDGGNQKDLRAARRAFVAETAQELLSRLDRIVRRPVADDGMDDPELKSDAASGMLLDLLFDEGLLPSYAFPTELCSFSVFERAGNRIRIKERPQQAKDKALSEYAPGRLLVVNKETYRVGGVFVEGRKTSSPAQEIFAAPLPYYVHCPNCTYVRLGQRPVTGESCPVCDQSLEEREMLDPPGFSPERGESVAERDSDQEFSYATGAQLPLPLAAEAIAWESDCGVHLRHAARMDQELVVVNQGPDQTGFAVCELCGAAWPNESAPATPDHDRPFLIEAHVLEREHARRRCSGPVRSSLFLGHTFRSDLLLLRLDLFAPLSVEPRDPWLHDALRTLAEALALAASLELDIDPGEISAGYRLIPPDGAGGGRGMQADLFLYDTASGGAGYSIEAGESLTAVLDRALDLLENCPKACGRSCVSCLRHYGNRFWHNNLDRLLAARLLRFLRTGEKPRPAPPFEQANQLIGLKRYLELEGWACSSLADTPGQQAPLVASRPPHSLNADPVSIWSWPALLDPVKEARSGDLGSHRAVLLRDYVVDRDLPSAFDQLTTWLKRAL